MASETEVAKLVARLTGDGSSYQAMLQEAMTATSDMGQEMSRAENAALSMQVAYDQLAAVHDELSDAVQKGTISFDEMMNIMEAAGQETEKVLRSIAAEEERYNAIMREGEAVTRNLMTAEEKHEQELQKLSNLLREGAISHETFTRGVIEAQKRLDSATPAVANFTTHLIGSGAAITAFGAAVTAAFGKLGYDALANWEEAEVTALKLEAALEANGRAVAETMEEYRTFASAVQEVSRIGDDTTLGLIQQAENFGLTGKAAERAAKNAIALGAAQGMSAQGAIRMTAALEQGHAEMLGRFMPALRGIKDETERAAKAQELIGKMWGVAEAESKSFGGQMAQLKNQFGDFLEEIGKVIADVLAPFAKGLREVVTLFQNAPQWVKVTIAGMIGLGLSLGVVLTTTGGLVIATGTLVTSYAALTPAITAATGTLAAFNATSVISIGAIGAMTGGLAILAAGLTYWHGKRMAEIADYESEVNKQNAYAEQRLQQAKRDHDQRLLAQGLVGKYTDEEKGIYTPPEKMDGSLQAVEELTKKYKEQAEVFGMTQRQAEIAGLRRSGVHENFLRELKKLDAQMTAMEDKEKATKKVEEERNRTMEEAKRIVEASLTPWQKYQAEVEKIKKLGEGGFLKTDEVSNALAHAKQEFDKINVSEDQKRAESLTKSLQTPIQKFREQVTDLQKFRVNKLIDEETFTRGLDEAKKEYDELTKDKEVKIKLKFEGVDAVAAGSLDALSRIAEFQSLKGGKAELGAMELAEQAGVDLSKPHEMNMGLYAANARRKKPGIHTPEQFKDATEFRQARDAGADILKQIASGIMELVGIGKKAESGEKVELVTLGG